MGLFGSNKQYLGIDIGSSAIKIVELAEEKKRPKLVTYGYVEQKNDILTQTSQEAKDHIVKGIQEIQQKARTTSTQVVAALPSYTVFASVIRLPQMNKKDLVKAVHTEAAKFVPMPIDEMIVDWKILDDDALTQHFAANQSASSEQSTDGSAKITSKQQKSLKILLTAAPKDLVSRYIDIFKQAKLQLVSLETESFALERTLIGNDKSPIMMIDMGATATTISVVADSVPLINRSIDVGGMSITKAIANSLNIEPDRAEQFKRDFGLAQPNSNGESPIPKRIQFMMTSIINEIRYVLKQYESQNQGTVKVDKIILAGGSAWLPNITTYLSQQLDVKVFLGDPWARVVYPMELKPVLQELGPRMAVSIGLAMRQIVQ
jgi:type IV pilus assembly protein PilM